MTATRRSSRLGDSTSIPTREGWLDLAVLLDAQLTRDALAMALRGRRPGAGLVHHTDRGSQYTCAGYLPRPWFNPSTLTPRVPRKRVG